MKNDEITKEAIIDICERIIEEGQTKLMQQTKISNEITLNLSNYIDANADIRRVKKMVVSFLKEQEIRLYEEDSDEEGQITDSREKYVKIFKDVSLNESINYYILIKLVYSDYMMDLLT